MVGLTLLRNERWSSGHSGSTVGAAIALRPSLVLVSVWVRGRVVLAALPHGLQGGSHEVGPGAAHEVGEERPG
jgi:hypothetical protein